MANDLKDKLIKELRIAKTEWLEQECDHETEKELVEYVADHLIEIGVIVPPCKVGDKVYQFDSAGNIYESEIKSIIYQTESIAFDERAIDENIFLSIEKLREERYGNVNL